MLRRSGTPGRANRLARHRRTNRAARAARRGESSTRRPTRSARSRSHHPRRPSRAVALSKPSGGATPTIVRSTFLATSVSSRAARASRAGRARRHPEPPHAVPKGTARCVSKSRRTPPRRRQPLEGAAPLRATTRHSTARISATGPQMKRSRLLGEAKLTRAARTDTPTRLHVPHRRNAGGQCEDLEPRSSQDDQRREHPDPNRERTCDAKAHR